MSHLGLLRLDARFPRLAGDAGRADSWALPLRVETVPGATPRRVVQGGDAALLAPLVAAARRLVDGGASAITTSCGFLVRFQAALQAALPVPVWTSALLWLAQPVGRAGVLTVDAGALGADELRAAGGAADTPVAGLAPGCHLQRVLLGDEPRLDRHRAERDAIDAAVRLVAAHPQVHTLVLECTNLPPHAAAIERATGRRVLHLIDYVQPRWRALHDPD